MHHQIQTSAPANVPANIIAPMSRFLNLNLTGVRRKKPILAIVYVWVCEYVIECVSGNQAAEINYGFDQPGPASR